VPGRLPIADALSRVVLIRSLWWIKKISQRHLYAMSSEGVGVRITTIISGILNDFGIDDAAAGCPIIKYVPAQL